PAVSAPGIFSWAGEGTTKPVTELAFETITVPLCKGIGIVVVSEELLRGGSGTAALLRDSLIAGLARFLDVQFTDPAVAAVPTISPGSITNGLVPVEATGI